MSMGDACDVLAYPKFFARGEIIFGVAGTLRIANILRYTDFPQPAEDEWNLDKWLVTELIPAIADAMPGSVDVDSDEGTGCGFIIVIRGRVYELSSDLAWKRYESGVYITGSGWAWATGAIAAGATVREALEIAARYDKGTGGPFHVRQASEILEDQE